MIVEPLALPGVLLIKPQIFHDARGRFLETWHRQRYHAANIPESFVQDNVSVSMKGVLRGLHYQHPDGQGKLISVLRGDVFDVAVDIRRGSATFGQWAGADLSAESGWQLYIPAGFAHGFAVLSPDTVVTYKCSEFRVAASEHCIRWDDPAIGIRWPVTAPIISDRDAGAPLLAEVPASLLPPMIPADG